MNIIKHILSKKQNSEHFISIIVYSTMEKNEISNKFKIKCSFYVDLTVREAAGHFDTLVKSTRICISQGSLE